MAMDIRRTDATVPAAPITNPGKTDPAKVKAKELHPGDKVEQKATHETAAATAQAPILDEAARSEAMQLFAALDALVGTKRPEGKIADFLELQPESHPGELLSNAFSP